jgi:signal transduction histidine kinase
VNSDLRVSAGSLQSDIERRRTELDAQAEAGGLFQIRKVDGELLYSSFQTTGADLPPPRNYTPDESKFFTARVQKQQLRLLYQPIVIDGTLLGSVELGQPLERTDEALTIIRGILIVGGLLTLVLISVPAYFLAGGALRPVRQVSQLARHLEQTADFSRRLPAAPAEGEIRELVETFNAMISRVERSLDVQSSFLADSSHELRRPLTLLRAGLDIFKDPTLTDDERKTWLSEMQEAADSMGGLLSDLLMLSREQSHSITRVPVDYSLLCEETVSRLRARDEGHKIESQIQPGLQVLGDRERLSQMLWNLLENAALYTPHGGRIEFDLGREDGRATVLIVDTGIGILPEELPKVFERFYRSDRARHLAGEGSGLGLAIVKYVAEAHGGSVHATSQTPGGTAISVHLPLVNGSR